VKSILKRLLLAALLFVNLSTLLLDWQIIEGMTSRDGVLVLSGNIVLSGIILCIYFLSLLLYKKLKTICFISGLCSLSMLSALEFSKFESYGRFNNSAIGVYLGLSTIIITIAAFILLLRKETFLTNK
jgi:hypothetical protein